MFLHKSPYGESVSRRGTTRLEEIDRLALKAAGVRGSPRFAPSAGSGQRRKPAKCGEKAGSAGELSPAELGRSGGRHLQ